MSNVKPYELLSLAFLPREEALKIADRSASECAAERRDHLSPAALVEALTIPPPRTMWNYRCNLCRAELPVFQDNNLCAECDFGVVD